MRKKQLSLFLDPARDSDTLKVPGVKRVHTIGDGVFVIDVEPELVDSAIEALKSVPGVTDVELCAPRHLIAPVKKGTRS